MGVMLSQEMRRNGMQEDEKKKGETKHEKLQTFQISAVGLVCMCIFFLSLSQQDGRRGGGGGDKKVLITMKDCNNSLLLLL